MISPREWHRQLEGRTYLAKRCGSASKQHKED
jgi:hypothetical protein